MSSAERQGRLTGAMGIPGLLLLAAITGLLSAEEPQVNTTGRFPTLGLLPKEEIGALRFLTQKPEYDGRGVVVAIFDTGVDPGAAGLQQTSDGRPKVIDMVDGTGSGDVEMAKVAKPENDTLEGLTGRTLKIDPAWENPSGEFRLGIKRAYDFFPESLISRLKRERREEFFEQHALVEAEASRAVEKFRSEHPKPTAVQKRQLEELEARLKQLQFAAKNYEDPGPLYDCVVFHDGKLPRAVIDTDEDGDLADESVLTNYRHARQFATFGGEAHLNFAVNIYQDGKRLSIVTDAGPHGTHVAGIVSAYYPEQPELNGIAPGAQIVSVKIGDSRLGGMETGAGLIRGLQAVVRNQCDLINMSYGEPTSTPDAGRLTELLSEMVEKHNVIFVASAGNAGPALSTVGAPGGTSSAILGVGAYVSPAMMQAEYTLRQQLPGMGYTWTSRGPTLDGDFGVDLFAPGGAIAPVPNWTMQRSMRMNGTSMASPNACGGIALLLSALKAENIAYAPHTVRRALQNTAQHVETADVFTEGPGLIQVDAAYEYFAAQTETEAIAPRYEVTLPTHHDARGLYLRAPRDTRHPQEATVRIRPVFHEDSDRRQRIDFEQKIVLESTAEWVESGSSVLLTHGGATFSVRVDPTGLEPGVHSAQVVGYAADHQDRGPLFRVPIVVTRLLEAEEEAPVAEFEETMTFASGEIERRFLEVPAGATWADIRLTSRSTSGEDRTYILHTVQALPGQTFEANESRIFLRLGHEASRLHTIPVTPGHTLELCLAQYWSSLGESEVDCTLTFHGLDPDDRSVTLSEDSPVAEVQVTSPLQWETLAPSGSLKTLRKLIGPSSAEIHTLAADRDTLPDGRPLYALEMVYRFDLSRKSTITARFPRNDDLLYDSAFGTQLWMIFDATKRRVATDDVYPENVRLEKGAHQLHIQFRHSDRRKIEELRQMPLSLDINLSSSIALEFFPSRAAALTDGEKFSPQRLAPGESASVCLQAPAMKSLPAEAATGDVLLGTISYGKADSARTGAGQRPGGYPVRYAVTRVAQPTSPSSATQAASSDDTDAEAEDDPEAAALLEFQMARLKKLANEKTAEQFEQLAERILKEHPGHLPVLVARLHRLDTTAERKKRLPAVVAAADAVLEQIDTQELARHFGTRVDPDDPAAQKARQRMEKQKSILIDALYRKGRALGYMELPDVIAEHPIENPEEHSRQFEANFAELQRWVDTTDEEYVLLHIRRERRRERFGAALELLNEQISKAKPTFWYHKKRRDIYEKLGWDHLWENERRWLRIRFPDAYEKF